MRKQVLGSVLCAAAVALSGCASWHAEHIRSTARAKTCANWRWIGVKSDPAAACPAPSRGDWSVEQLFAIRDYKPNYGYRQEPPPPPSGAGGSGAELDRFCVYETGEKGPQQPPVKSPREAGLLRLDRDCAAITPTAYDYKDGGWPEVADHVLTQAGVAPLNIQNRGGVRLTFVDTQPTGDGVPETAGFVYHGYTLAHLAKALVCSPATGTDGDLCAATIATRLATPYQQFDPNSRALSVINTTQGGAFGTQSDLAEAIRAEVNDWVTSPVRRPTDRLVLNVSLAWDPGLFGGIEEDGTAEDRSKELEAMEAGTRAIYAALADARSAGVLVVVAAGNRRDCVLATRGPALPAAWEQDPPVDARTSQRREGPVVYAVGGVKSDNTPLHNHRTNGMPKLVAYGEHVLLPRPADEYTTWRYTGSSVAAAIVSSTAALVWDSFYTLSRDEVMAALYDSGSDAHFPADFSFRDGATAGGAQPMAKRITACAALKYACTNRTALGGDLTQMGEHCQLLDPMMECPVLVEATTAYPEQLPGDWAPQPFSNSCYYWVGPQPEDPPCPPCHKPPV
jgi:hypothetical protein